LGAELQPEPVVLRGDQSALTHALVNLVQNALDFTPRGGEVRVAVRVDRAAGVAELSVTDTGTGIPPEDLPHIFERFYRGHNRRAAEQARGRARGAGGAGLGLSIVQQAVEGLGGRVTVASTPGQGSRFTLHLPLPPAPPKAAAGAPTGSPSRRPARPGRPDRPG
ncbi:MAG: ATP-binding protein, partial [Bacillota bacterium]|nr:ATP-binding protein [Bacillota bacterium]